MITHKQLVRMEFSLWKDKEYGYINVGFPQNIETRGVISGGVFYWIFQGETRQAKNINHMRHLYLKDTGKKLVKYDFNPNDKLKHDASTLTSRLIFASINEHIKNGLIPAYEL